MNAAARRGLAARAGAGEARPEPAAGRWREILAILRASVSPLSILDIARQLDVHPNTVRFHLEALTGSGQAERAEAARTSPGRPPLMFRARPGMDPSGPRNYRLLAGILADSLAGNPDPAGRAADAGRAWGRRLAGTSPAKPGTAGEDAAGRWPASSTASDSRPSSDTPARAGRSGCATARSSTSSPTRHG